MKGLACVVLILIMVSYGAFAGSVPEDLSGNTGLIYFGEVTAYEESDETITIVPSLMVKGDAAYIDVEQSYNRALLVGIRSLEIGQAYLVAYYDENNPLYVFETTTFDTSTLEIKGIEGMDMWERFQEYLNNGDYGHIRLARIAENEPISGELAQVDEFNYRPFILVAAFIVAIYSLYRKLTS